MASVPPENAGEAANQLQAVLAERTGGHYGATCRIENLHRLSGGASQETWSFDVLRADLPPLKLILKRDPAPTDSADSADSADGPVRLGLDRRTEGQLIARAGEAGVPAPPFVLHLQADERTTAGFVTEYLPGEVLGRRILREPELAQAREKLAFQCGEAAARLHAMPTASLPPLAVMDIGHLLAYYRELMDQSGHPWPSFEYAFRWLGERQQQAGQGRSFVHGDFRNGNMIVDADGLRGILDFELGHLGNPISDLGWLCVRSWRFGHYGKPVGGFGEVAELLAGYEAAGGGTVAPEAVYYWEVFGTLRWGLLCMGMGFGQLQAGSGRPGSLEHAAVGRRTAETEYDLLQMLS